MSAHVHGPTTHSVKLHSEECNFGPWKILSRKGPILKSDEADSLTDELGIPALPEMVFGDSLLRIEHVDGFGMEFNARDALRKVDTKQDSLKVAAAEEWQRLRDGSEFIKNVVKPYDWTYTTDYVGTLFNSSSGKEVEVSSTLERIDIEKLKARERIHFYADLLLFEDELADHGAATFNVKIRVMPSSFFILIRYFLRVDSVLIRMNDTRIYHEAGWNHILREFSSKEKKICDLKDARADQSEIAAQLDATVERFEKLSFPLQTPL